MRRHATDHRIAAGQRVVGQKQHRLAVAGHLDRAQRRAFRRQLHALHRRNPLQRPLTRQPQADPAGLRRHLPGLRLQQGNRFVIEPVGAGAGHHVQQHGVLHRVVTRPWQHRRRLHTGQHRPGHLPPCPQALPRHQRGRTDAGQRVGGPAAQHRRHGKAAPHGQIAAQPGLGRADRQHVTGIQGQHLLALRRHVRAIGMTQQQRSAGTGHRHLGVRQHPDREATVQQLQHRRLADVAHQAVGGTHCAAVERAGSRHALPGLPRPAQILKERLQARGQHLKNFGAFRFPGIGLRGCRIR